MFDFLPHFDMTQLAITLGYIGLISIVFAETGVFLGFFLPGDSLLFAAGLLASQGLFKINILAPALVIAAIAGYALAYWFGKHLGNWLLKRRDSFWFKKRYLAEAGRFYERHGGKALIIGRLVPIVRTFVPIVAGMTKMSYRLYSIYNVIGGLVWAGGITLIGYYIGAIFPGASHYILPLAIGIIVLSMLPAIYHLSRERCQRRSNAANATRSLKPND